MKKHYIVSLGLLVAWSGVVSAQVEPTIAMAIPERPVSTIWVNTEYLLGWTKNGPMPFPLVTTGDPNDPISPGAVDRPGTVPIFGGNGFNYGTFSGMRLTLGGWLDGERLWGLEGSAFFLQQRSVRFSAGSDDAGNPPLYVPRFAADLGREGSFTIADPVAGFAGSIFIVSRTRLWGAEANGLVNLWTTPRFDVDGLLGFRYLDLAESLTIDAPNLGVIGVDINDAVRDQFRTRNQFYGGQVGARLRMENGPLSFIGTAKLALGGSHQVVDIQGSTTETGTASANLGTFPGGIFSQPTNMGQRSSNQFTVIPEIQLQLGYQWRPWLRTFVGYDFLYWNQVVRPGSQIDRSVNATQSILQGGALVGVARPMPLFDRTDFWAQALTFGLELKY